MKKTSDLSRAIAVVVAGCAISLPGSGFASTSTEACKAVSEQEVAALFDRWNVSLQSGDPDKVVANYADGSVLLPTVSNQPRLTVAEKKDYFIQFQQSQPAGEIDSRTIQIGCNTAVDTGLYTFTYGTTGASVKARYTYTYSWDGEQWLITSHHSSAMPEN